VFGAFEVTFVFNQGSAQFKAIITGKPVVGELGHIDLFPAHFSAD